MSLYIYNVCCVVLCGYVLLNHFTLLHCFFSPHTFQIPAKENSHFAPFVFLRTITNNPYTMHRSDIVI